MNIDNLIESINPFAEPLIKVDHEDDYPNLKNPLHVVILLLICDAETLSGGLLGFIENPSGQHLSKTIEMLHLIGAHKTADKFNLLLRSMEKHNITWKNIMGENVTSNEYTISSFDERHSDEISNNIEQVLDEVRTTFWGFQMFDPEFFGEDVYQCLIDYLKDKSDILKKEIAKREIKPNKSL